MQHSHFRVQTIIKDFSVESERRLSTKIEKNDQSVCMHAAIVCLYSLCINSSCNAEQLNQNHKCQINE